MIPTTIPRRSGKAMSRWSARDLQRAARYGTTSAVRSDARAELRRRAQRRARAGDSVIIEGREFIVATPERGCACHPAMPAERTPDGWACKGCGVRS